MLIDLFQREHHDAFHASAAFLWKARALLLLEREEEAFAAFEDALDARRALPNVINDAWLDYALTVARRGVRQRYDRVLDVLQEFAAAPTALVLPAEQFQYFAALALISADLGDREEAGRWARNALDAAARVSPFQRHAHVGVVGTTHADLQVELARLADQV